MAKTAVEVGEAMRAARERQKRTQAQVAADLGVTQPCVARWEAGSASPAADRIRDVAAVYKLKPEQLLPERAA